MASSRLLVLAVAVVALAVLLGLATSQERPAGGETDAELTARGVTVYLEQGCGACHALKAAGTEGSCAPNHDELPALAATRIADAAYAGEAEDAAGYIRESIVAPAAYMVPDYGFSYHRMPAYDFLSDGDLDALVALLGSAGNGEGE